MRPVGLGGISPHQSGAVPFTMISDVFTTRSGVPIDHWVLSFHVRAGGMSAAFPRGAPESAHLAMSAISVSESDGSFLKC